MWKKLKTFKFSGTNFTNPYQKCLVILVVLLSNVFFYLLVVSPPEKIAPIKYPQGFTKVQIEAKSMITWEPLKKVSLYEGGNKILIEEIYMSEENKNEGQLEILVRESELLKLIGYDGMLYLLPYQRKIAAKKNEPARSENIEIIF